MLNVTFQQIYINISIPILPTSDIANYIFQPIIDSSPSNGQQVKINQKLWDDKVKELLKKDKEKDEDEDHDLDPDNHINGKNLDDDNDRT